MKVVIGGQKNTGAQNTIDNPIPEIWIRRMTNFKSKHLFNKLIKGIIGNVTQLKHSF